MGKGQLVQPEQQARLMIDRLLTVAGCDFFDLTASKFSRRAASRFVGFYCEVGCECHC